MRVVRWTNNRNPIKTLFVYVKNFHIRKMVVEKMLKRQIPTRSSRFRGNMLIRARFPSAGQKQKVLFEQMFFCLCALSTHLSWYKYANWIVPWYQRYKYIWIGCFRFISSSHFSHEIHCIDSVNPYGNYRSHDELNKLFTDSIASIPIHSAAEERRRSPEALSTTER